VRNGVLHLGYEIRVAGRVDQIDGGAIDGERDDRGLDRDPALALQRQRIGLRRALIDAAGLVDNTSAVEQSLRQRCLAGVNMGSSWPSGARQLWLMPGSDNLLAVARARPARLAALGPEPFYPAAPVVLPAVAIGPPQILAQVVAVEHHRVDPGRAESPEPVLCDR
jgi:hypothetical protein